ncbi:hypothetical protein [Paenibacillus lactis]|uniref:hypothetical protein n=1 Tax=Paenibacillus lactis TaxID=228574 RepID=UPI0005932797|nr:hypothetical protein [Paenibacillus lactis]
MTTMIGYYEDKAVIFQSLLAVHTITIPEDAVSELTNMVTDFDWHKRKSSWTGRELTQVWMLYST